MILLLMLPVVEIVWVELQRILTDGRKQCMMGDEVPANLHVMA